MADLADFSTQNLETLAGPGHEMFEAVILDDGVAGVPVRVRLPDSPELSTDPCPWTPIVTVDGIFYPHAGDACVVVQPAQGNPWIASWVPSVTEPDGEIAGAGDKHYAIPFSPATVLNFTHNLGKRPSVTLVDSAGTEQIAEVEHLSDNACRAFVTHPFSGTAYFN